MQASELHLRYLESLSRTCPPFVCDAGAFSSIYNGIMTVNLNLQFGQGLKREIIFGSLY